jgi:PhnB protein
MESNRLTHVTQDIGNRKLIITRQFEEPPELVWMAWTESDLLDQWWAPKPYKTRTKIFDFAEGGCWLYSLVAPNGDQHWSRMDFDKIDFQKTFELTSSSCDEQGNIKNELQSRWRIEFLPVQSGTTVTIEISAPSAHDLKQLVEKGFEAELSDALENLRHYLRAKFKLRNQLKMNTKSRVTTYLNFPGNTEKAFSFYKTVFGTEFSGKGIQRFGDLNHGDDHQMSEEVKKMVLHIELPILGGHVIMASDAPKEMGFEVIQGNNMHICLEPSSRAETKKLFDTLSTGGTIIMPIQDMPFGSYYGTLTDKFGINWMLNFIEK